MKSDERIIEQRTQLEAVETLLKDKRIGKELGEEIRTHFLLSKNSSNADNATLMRYLLHTVLFVTYSMLHQQCCFLTSFILTMI
jgi:hypothetical protein